MHRQIAGKLTGRVTKWLVLAFWIVMLVVFGGFAGKLSSVQDNQASSWLPANAESTKALQKLEPFQDQNDIPTTIVYHRSSGLTDADLATIATQVEPDPGAQGCQADPGTRRQAAATPGTGPAVQGQAGRPGLGHLQLRHQRLERPARRRQADPQDRHHPRRHRPPRRAGRPGRRLGPGVLRPRRQAARLHRARGDRDPAHHLPQPGALDPPGALGGSRARDGPGGDLPAGQERRAHRQRAEPGHPDRARLRRRHRLRPPAGRALPRGASRARRPARGDGERTASRRPSHRGQRRSRSSSACSA